MFPNHGMESHFVGQTKKYRTRVEKNRHLTKKKDDFGNALQNLCRELERAENVVGPSSSRLRGPFFCWRIGTAITVRQ